MPVPVQFSSCTRNFPVHAVDAVLADRPGPPGKGGHSSQVFKRGMLFIAPLGVYVFFALLSIMSVVSEPRKRQLLWGVENAVPDDLLSSLSSESSKVHQWTKSSPSLIHGKHRTFWFDLKSNPRLCIEHAILTLRENIRDEMLGGGHTIKDIVGAEWWVQIKGISQGISFHFDKDEGLASTEGKMLHPLLSTVTYLTSVGAPTLIFDMVTPDGNVAVPDIPTEGFLSYPKINRHIIFAGNLQHGVLSLAAKESNESLSSINVQRVTLLINWWTLKPREPNTVSLSDSMAAAMGLYWCEYTSCFTHSTVDLKESRICYSRRPSPLAAIPLLVNSDSMQNIILRRHEIIFPPGDMHSFDLPINLTEGLYAIRWGPHNVYGGISLLNLFNSAQVSHLFSIQQPKVIFMYRDEDTASFDAMRYIVFPLAKKYLGLIKVGMICAFPLQPEFR